MNTADILKSEYEFDEKNIEPTLPFSVRHFIIEGVGGVDEVVSKYYDNAKKVGQKVSDIELNNFWWQTYKELLLKKGYNIKE